MDELKDKKNKVKKIIRLFERYYPEVRCALNYSSPFELLIATMLSAQCTDERVNMVTKKLFVDYPTIESFAQASQHKMEEAVHSTGFYRNKAKNIIACCKVLLEKHKGKVPKDINLLVELAGVGRKTANVVLGNAFNISSGVVVDTHVTRISNKLHLVKGKNAVIIERELNQIVDKKHWIKFPHWMITHGRAVCKARTPQCHICFLKKMCPSSTD